MICSKCNTENKDGAAFCVNCGSKLEAADASQMEPMKDDDKTTIIDVKSIAGEEIPSGAEAEKPEAENLEAEQQDAEDSSEDNTTVLTNNMAITPEEPVPFSPAPPIGFDEPQGMPGAPMGSPMPPQGMPGAPMGSPVPPQGMPGAPMGSPMPPQGMPGAPMSKPEPKKEKAPKAPKQKSKCGTGCKVYIIISIVLMLAMGGAIGYGLYYFNGKLDDKDDEIEQIENELSYAEDNYYASSQMYDDSIAEINSLNQQLSDAQDTIANYEMNINQMQEFQEGYAEYDNLIMFSDNYSAQGTADFMCGDTILTVANGSTSSVCVLANKGNEVTFNVYDSSVVDVEWAEDEVEGNLFTLNITGKSEGNTIVAVSDNEGNVVEIFVTVK